MALEIYTKAALPPAALPLLMPLKRPVAQSCSKLFKHQPLFDAIILMMIQILIEATVADAPLPVFFKLPISEISEIDDHKSVSLLCKD